MTNMKLIILILLSLSTQAFAQMELCDRKGAYGISFGEKPPRGSKEVSSTEAVRRYRTTAKMQDDRFDDYFITTGRSSGKVYKIIATHYIKPVPTLATGDLPIQKREENLLIAHQFIEEILSHFSEETRRHVMEKNDTWEINLENNLKLTLSIPNYWSIDVECLNIQEENDMVKKFWK